MVEEEKKAVGRTPVVPRQFSFTNCNNLPSDRSEDYTGSPYVPAVALVKTSGELKLMPVNADKPVMFNRKMQHLSGEQKAQLLPIALEDIGNVADKVIVDNEEHRYDTFSENSFDSADMEEASPKEAIL